MSTTPQFASNPKIGISNISVANTNINGSGTISTVFSAGSLGSKINEVAVCGVGSVSAGMVRLFINDSSNNYLFDEVPISATTPSSSVSNFRTTKTYDNLVLPSGYSLRAATNNAENFNIIVCGADL